ncbi:hypothetical protein OAL13_00125 [bacterium]|nr:hypothetical protein [bacterium]
MNNIIKALIGVTVTASVSFGGFTGVKAIQKENHCQALEAEGIKALELAATNFRRKRKADRQDFATPYAEFYDTAVQLGLANVTLTKIKKELNETCGANRFLGLLEKPELTATVAYLHFNKEHGKDEPVAWLVRILEGNEPLTPS